MVTGTSWAEHKARLMLKKRHTGGLVLKMPDFKQTGQMGSSGLPDFLVLHKDQHYWYEIKLIQGENLFPLSTLSESQWIKFRKFLEQGIDVSIITFTPKQFVYEFKFSALMQKYSGNKSIPFSSF